jgi:hypothetical protein
MASSDLIDIAKRAGARVEQIDRKNAWALMQAWRETYCAPVHEVTGKWVHNEGHGWHTFSNGFFRCLNGQKAILAYAQQRFEDVLAIPEDDHTIAIRYVSQSPVDFSGLQLDVYVGPPDFAWTIVFPHGSPDQGPYFSQADWR